MINKFELTVPDNFIEKIYDLKRISKATLRSNVLGWQSEQYTSFETIQWAEDFFKNCMSIANLQNPLQHVWFNINPNGSFHKWHSHGSATVVGVFYIQVPKNSGNIEFRGLIKDSIEPANGMMLIFPSGVNHQVLKNNSTEDRITMAFNLGPTT